MSYRNDPFGRRRYVAGPRPGSLGISMEEVQRLVQAYQTLQEQAAKQAQELAQRQRELEAAAREVTAQTKTTADLQRELEIKNETLRRQTEDVRKLEAELVYAKAALQQQDRQADSSNAAEEMSWRERYLRLQAELESLRRRWEQRFETETAAARHGILLDMLPLADHLEMAIKHGAGLGPDAADYQRNLEATYQAFMNTLKRYGVTPIDAHNQPFDPNLHEAVGRVPADGGESGTVAEVTQTGYTEGERLLRPARVLVRE